MEVLSDLDLADFVIMLQSVVVPGWETQQQHDTPIVF